MAQKYNLEVLKPHLDKLLAERMYPKTICPSEMARALSDEEIRSTGAVSWKELMPAFRKEAFYLRDKGYLEILQKGKVLPNSQGPDQTKGPIRLRQK